MKSLLWERDILFCWFVEKWINPWLWEHVGACVSFSWVGQHLFILLFEFGRRTGRGAVVPKTTLTHSHTVVIRCLLISSCGLQPFLHTLDWSIHVMFILLLTLSHKRTGQHVLSGRASSCCPQRGQTPGMMVTSLCPLSLMWMLKQMNQRYKVILFSKNFFLKSTVCFTVILKKQCVENVKFTNNFSFLLYYWNDFWLICFHN